MRRRLSIYKSYYRRDEIENKGKAMSFKTIGPLRAGVQLWRDSNPFIQPPGGEKGVPGVLHQPIYQAYKGGLKLGLTRPITVSTGACAACHKLYQVVVGSLLASALSS